MDVCVVCLENNGGTLPRINITSKKWKERNMQQIIEKHLWWWNLKQPAKKGLDQWICQPCWHDLSSFHNFYQRSKRAHKIFRLSMKQKIFQAFTETDENISLHDSEPGGRAISNEPTTIQHAQKQLRLSINQKVRQDENPIQLQTSGDIDQLLGFEERNIHAEEIAIIDVKKEQNSDTHYSQQQPMEQNDEEILPNLIYSVANLSNSTSQHNVEKSNAAAETLSNMQSFRDLKSLLEQQSELSKRIYGGINELKSTVAKQTNSFSNVLCSQLSELKSSFHSHFEAPKFTALFPIQAEEDLCALENMITEENKTEIVSSIKRIIGPKGIEKNICHIFSQELLFEFNINGIYGKKRLMDYEKTMNVLFLASASDGKTSLVEFMTHFRKAIKTAKNRYFKAECMKRKRVGNESGDGNFEIFDDNSLTVQNEPGGSGGSYN